FASIEDARFQITRSMSTGPWMTAGFQSSIMGRDSEGRREWLSGSGLLFARSGPAGWHLLGLNFKKASSLIAARDFFTDVSASAGVERADPTLMARGGTGL